jgi:hypothetical protein
MDEQRFDNIARRLGGLRTRRAALKTAGCGTAAAVFAVLGLENSALAQVTTEDHCTVRTLACNRNKECCGYSRKRRREIVCKPSNAGPGDRCCGQRRASCRDDADCCLTFRCSTTELECVPA